MAAKALSAADRIAINDVLNEYAWANDSHNVDLMVSLFTKDATLTTGHGESYKGSDGVRHFITSHAAQGNRGGRQHLVQQALVRARPEGAAVRSYWMVVQAVVAENKRFIRSMGYNDDLMVKVKGEWKIKRRTMGSWNDQTPTPPMLEDAPKAKPRAAKKPARGRKARPSRGRR
jgi:uncharacterized protein (TIGR02246 family)